MASDEPANAESFWRFSLMVYAGPGVAEALVRLQDRGGHNVNLILFGLWLGICEGAGLDAAALTRARAAIAGLDRGIVAPLRHLRRSLKNAPDPDLQDLRRRLSTLEIAAERRVQARLAGSLVRRGKAGAAGRVATAAANLQLILGADSHSPEAELLRQTIAATLLSSFPQKRESRGNRLVARPGPPPPRGDD